MGRSISLSCLRVDLVYVVTYHASDCEEKFSLQHYGYQRSIGKLWIHFICDTYLWKTTINQEFCIAPDARWKPYFVATQCSTAGNLFPSLARWYLRPTGQHENDHCILLRGTRAPMAGIQAAPSPHNYMYGLSWRQYERKKMWSRRQITLCRDFHWEELFQLSFATSPPTCKIFHSWSTS